MFNIKLDKEIIYSYYEIEYKHENLSKISQIFNLTENLTESWDLLIENINEFEKDISFELNKNKLILTLKFKLPTKKIKTGEISLDKNEYDLNYVLNKLDTKFNLIQNNQLKIEKKLDEKLNLIVSEQKTIKNDLDKNIKNIKTINLSHTKLEDIINQNTNAIKKIEEDQKIFKNKFEIYGNQIETNKNNQLKNENNINELNNYIYNNFDFDLFKSMGKKLNLIEKNQDKLKEIINNNNKEINQINKEIYNCKDSLEKVNKDIILIEQSQKNMKNNFDYELLKINSLELNQSKLEKKGEDNVKNINESLKKALKEIELLKNKINENGKDIKIFKEKIKKLEEEEERKKEEKEDKKDNEKYSPSLTKALKTIQYSVPEKRTKIKIINREKSRNYLNDNNYLTINNDSYHLKKPSLLTEPNLDIQKEENNEGPKDEFNEKLFNKRLERNLTETNFFNRPHNFNLNKTISINLFNKNCYNTRACIFPQKEKIYIVYGIRSLDLVCYDYYFEDTFILINKLHKEPFDSCRHFYDNDNDRDLIITSSLDRHVKVTHFKKRFSTVILDLNFDYIENVTINTAYLINNKIMIPFAFHNKIGKISFYDLKGFKLYKEIEDPGFVLCLNSYYHEYKKIYYAIVSNTKGIYVYNINDYILYNKFTQRMFIKDNSFS